MLLRFLNKLVLFVNDDVFSDARAVITLETVPMRLNWPLHGNRYVHLYGSLN